MGPVGYVALAYLSALALLAGFTWTLRRDRRALKRLHDQIYQETR